METHVLECLIVHIDNGDLNRDSEGNGDHTADLRYRRFAGAIGKSRVVEGHPVVFDSTDRDLRHVISDGRHFERHTRVIRIHDPGSSTLSDGRCRQQQKGKDQSEKAHALGHGCEKAGIPTGDPAARRHINKIPEGRQGRAYKRKPGPIRAPGFRAISENQDSIYSMIFLSVRSRPTSGS